MRAAFVLLALLLAAPLAAADVAVERIDVPERTKAGQAFPVSVAIENDGPARTVYLFGALYDRDAGAAGGPCGPSTDPRFRTFTHLVQEPVELAANGVTTHPAPGSQWLHRYGAGDVDAAPRDHELCVFVANASATGPLIDYEAFGATALNARGVNAAPVASFTWSPARPVETETVRFEATGSDADGDPIAYRWDFGHDGASGRVVGEGETATAFFYPAGEFVVTLYASDGMDEAPETQTIAVDPRPEGPTGTDPQDGDARGPLGVPLDVWPAVAAALVALAFRRRA